MTISCFVLVGPYTPPLPLQPGATERAARILSFAKAQHASAFSQQVLKMRGIHDSTQGKPDKFALGMLLLLPITSHRSSDTGPQV